MKFYRILNYISLDVACGAMVCAAFFAHIFEVRLRAYGLATLGITVWMIYTADHLLDARRIQREASTERHRFHQRNSRSMLVALVVAGLVDLFLIQFIRKPVLIWGAGLSVLVAIYIFFQRSLGQFKEVVISILYAAGVVLPALSLTGIDVSLQALLILASFTLTALINLILFSWFECEQDITDGQTSIVTFLGKKYASKLISVLFAVQAGIWIGLGFYAPGWRELAVLSFMNIPLLFLFLIPGRFFKDDTYRFVGDLVFLFPLPYLLLS